MPGVPGEIACGTGNEIGLPYTARLEVAGEATTPRASFIYVPYGVPYFVFQRVHLPTPHSLCRPTDSPIFTS